MTIARAAFIAGITVFCSPLHAVSQDAADTMIVFDGSGSMWGQIEGRAKIEIARDTLSSALSETISSQNIGMIAYGHRQKGVCSDIETVVPLGPAGQTVPAMIDTANKISPRGKTPLTDAVRKAAQELKFTENAATVVLLTDGIETCEADPCALAAELERLGVNFTAHVVGFGLSDDERKQVQCLADNTGGTYYSAQNADELSDALRDSVQAAVEIPSSDEDFVDAEPATRNILFRFRDTPDGDQIGARQLTGHLERADGTRVDADAFAFAFPEAKGLSATAQLEPGSYVGVFRRDGGSSGGYDVRYAFDVPEGPGDHVIEASFAGSLQIDLFINPKQPFTPGDPFPRATSGSSPRIHIAVHPVENGVVAPEPVAKGTPGSLTFPLPAGQYVVRGNLDRTTAAEQVVNVAAGGVTQHKFSFNATRVYVDARQSDGTRVKSQTTFWYDKIPSGRNYWVRGGGIRDGQVLPFYLPTGEWVVNVGGEGTGKRRSEVLITVPGDYAEMRIEIGESQTLGPDDRGYLSSPAYTGCLEILRVVRNGCLVERAELGVEGSGAPEKVAPRAEAEDTPAAPSEPEQPTPTPDDAQDKTDLDGQDDQVLRFVAERGEGQLQILANPAVRSDATLILSDGWCGAQNCEGARLSVPYDSIVAARTPGYASWTVTEGGYLFLFRKEGLEVEVQVSGAGGRDVAFRLQGEDAGAPADVADAPQEPIVGVYSLHPDSDLQELLAGSKVIRACQTNPIIFFPDGGVEVKTFTTNGGSIGYRSDVQAVCTSQSGQMICNDQSGTPAFAELPQFTAQLLEDVHYRFCNPDGSTCQLATACFFADSDMLAATPMPGGGTLVEMLLERSDGKPAGFAYSYENSVTLP